MAKNKPKELTEEAEEAIEEIEAVDNNMNVNSGGAFFHPVTHQLIQPCQFYDGNAHQDYENKK